MAELRHGLPTLRTVWKKIDYGVRSVVCFLRLENNSRVEIHRICTAYGEENVMNLQNMIAVDVPSRENKHTR